LLKIQCLSGFIKFTFVNSKNTGGIHTRLFFLDIHLPISDIIAELNGNFSSILTPALL
jgi:hypothetical protein